MIGVGMVGAKLVHSVCTPQLLMSAQARSEARSPEKLQLQRTLARYRVVDLLQRTSTELGWTPPRLCALSLPNRHRDTESTNETRRAGSCPSP